MSVSNPPEDEQINDLVETIYWGKEWTRDD